MSYVDEKGNRSPRVTFVCGLLDCPIPAIIEKRKGRKRKQMTNITSAIGTIIHGEIENFIKIEMGIPLSKHEMRKSDATFIRQEALREKEGFPNRFTLKRERCMPAFHKFWRDYKTSSQLTPIYVEKRVGSSKIGMGTADLIALLSLKGRTYNLEGVTWFEECTCKDDCNCQTYKTITVLDWKTGKSYQKKSYQSQGAAYIHAAMESEAISSSKYPINSHAWCILLGDPRGYKIGKGSYHDGISDYMRGLKIFHNPEKHLREKCGELTLTSKCMFCSYILECPNRVITSSEESDVIIDGTDKNEADV